MKIRLLIALVCVGLTIIASDWDSSRAQDDSTTQVLLTSPDPTHAVQFQLLAEDTVSILANFTDHLELAIDQDSAATLVYVSVHNTGWSEGVIGVSSPHLDADADYVALELGVDGAPRAGGLAFACTYDDDLDDIGGLTLGVLIAQAHRFGIYQLVDGDGLTYEGWTNQRQDDGQVTQVAVTYNVEPAPVLNLQLDVHIVATAASAPAANPSAEGTTGDGWGGCGSCDSCGYPAEECVQSPDGACIWDPGTCSGQAGAGGRGDVPEGCLVLTVTTDGGGSVSRDPASNCGDGYRPGTFVTLVAHPWGGRLVWNWSGNCSDLETPAFFETVQGVIMNDSCSVHVRFYKP